MTNYLKSGKFPKILNTLFHTPLALVLLFVQLFLAILSGTTNSIDPDLGLHCLHMSFVRHFGVQNFRTFTVIALA